MTAIVVVSNRLWQVYQPAAKSRKAIKSVSASDNCLVLSAASNILVVQKYTELIWVFCARCWQSWKSNTIYRKNQKSNNINEFHSELCPTRTFFVQNGIFLKTFGFVTYASMGAWHAAVTNGLNYFYFFFVFLVLLFPLPSSTLGGSMQIFGCDWNFNYRKRITVQDMCSLLCFLCPTV